MPTELNSLKQPIGPEVRHWTPPPRPARVTLQGRFCRLEPLGIHHARSLHGANAKDVEGRNWTYLPYGPFDSLPDYGAWVEEVCDGDDPLFYAIMDPVDGQAMGVASYLRITPGSGSIEVGHIHYSPRLQRTPAATEAMYLMMKQAFELGYRRYEWKCDALNAPSRRAALRLGLSFEGIFRQATIVKGRSRDSAWYAAIHSEWPAIEAALSQWLDPSGFHPDGSQRIPLSVLTAPRLRRRIVETES